MKKIYYLFWVIFFLIRNKGCFEIDMQKPDFNNEYYVDKDGEDFYINTTFWDIILDIYACNK